jgi:tRNA(Ile)-lysidine synthase
LPRPSDLAARFREHWARTFARGGGPIVVAVSGGIDSMTLLALLARERLGGDGADVVAAHFDHGMRGPAGAEDGRFVEAVAARWGARAVRGTGDAPARAREGRRGPMTAARELRYAFLAGVAEREGAWAIATAHQRDDRVETALLRIVRGASPEGLAGLEAVGERLGRLVIRPLLPYSRAEIERWAEETGVPFREDPSNRDPRYPRSRVRAELLPLLREMNPRVDAAIARLADLAAADAEWMGAATDELLESATESQDEREWTLSAARIADAPAALLGRAIVAAWAWSAPPGARPPDADWIGGVAKFLRGGRGGRVAAPGGGEIARRGPRVVVRRPSPQTEQREEIPG